MGLELRTCARKKQSRDPRRIRARGLYREEISETESERERQTQNKVVSYFDVLRSIVVYQILHHGNKSLTDSIDGQCPTQLH